MKINIAIIGLGNIGKRHLQAVSRLDFFEEINCYDIMEISLNSVSDFCEKNMIKTEKIKLVFQFDDLLKKISQNTIVIVATIAKGRYGVLKTIIDRNPLAVIAEKPLCQNIMEYEDIVNYSKKNGTNIFINFSRHCYSAYQTINEYLNNEEFKVKHFVAFFSGGMACVGIHIIDLATWLLKGASFKLKYSKKEEVYETKRTGYSDFSGEMLLNINEESNCFFMAERKQMPIMIDINTEKKQLRIFESADKMVVVNSDSDGINLSDYEIVNTSQITDKVIEDIMNKKKPQLPDIFESYLAHKILFEYMRINGLEEVNIT
jgi:predicted dehydrogenase